MTTNRPVAGKPGEPDLPTPAAHLIITAEPTRLRAEGRVPPADARYLIATFGITTTMAMSTIGVIIVYRFALSLALAVVLLGLVSIAAIVFCQRDRGRPQ
jgi:hypothetical protein